MTPTGTRMSQDEYNKLASAFETRVLSDAEAVVLLNGEFGFEASRIQILHEAEIDITEEGSRYVQIKKVQRSPVYSATDWNYIRFNVRCAPGIWQYEMVNAGLYFLIT